MSSKRSRSASSDDEHHCRPVATVEEVASASGQMNQVPNQPTATDTGNAGGEPETIRTRNIPASDLANAPTDVLVQYLSEMVGPYLRATSAQRTGNRRRRAISDGEQNCQCFTEQEADEHERLAHIRRGPWFPIPNSAHPTTRNANRVPKLLTIFGKRRRRTQEQNEQIAQAIAGGFWSAASSADKQARYRPSAMTAVPSSSVVAAPATSAAGGSLAIQMAAASSPSSYSGAGSEPSSSSSSSLNRAVAGPSWRPDPLAAESSSETVRGITLHLTRTASSTSTRHSLSSSSCSDITTTQRRSNSATGRPSTSSFRRPSTILEVDSSLSTSTEPPFTADSASATAPTTSTTSTTSSRASSSSDCSSDPVAARPSSLAVSTSLRSLLVSRVSRTESHEYHSPVGPAASSKALSDGDLSRIGGGGESSQSSLSTSPAECREFGGTNPVWSASGESLPPLDAQSSHNTLQTTLGCSSSLDSFQASSSLADISSIPTDRTGSSTAGGGLSTTTQSPSGPSLSTGRPRPPFIHILSATSSSSSNNSSLDTPSNIRDMSIASAPAELSPVPERLPERGSSWKPQDTFANISSWALSRREDPRYSSSCSIDMGASTDRMANVHLSDDNHSSSCPDCRLKKHYVKFSSSDYTHKLAELSPNQRQQRAPFHIEEVGQQFDLPMDVDEASSSRSSEQSPEEEEEKAEDAVTPRQRRLTGRERREQSLRSRRSASASPYLRDSPTGSPARVTRRRAMDRLSVPVRTDLDPGQRMPPNRPEEGEEAIADEIQIPVPIKRPVEQQQQSVVPDESGQQSIVVPIPSAVASYNHSPRSSCRSSPVKHHPLSTPEKPEPTVAPQDTAAPHLAAPVPATSSSDAATAQSDSQMSPPPPRRWTINRVREMVTRRTSSLDRNTTINSPINRTVNASNLPSTSNPNIHQSVNPNPNPNVRPPNPAINAASPLRNPNHHSRRRPHAMQLNEFHPVHPDANHPIDDDDDEEEEMMLETSF